MTKCVCLTETITNRKISEMSGLKRAFPFSDEDVPYTSLPDFISVKRPCLPSKCSNTSQTGIKQSGISTCDHVEMDYDSYPGNLCKNGTLIYPEMQNGDMSCFEVTNNNSTSTICTRCQAGEPFCILDIDRSHIYNIYLPCSVILDISGDDDWMGLS